MLRSLTGLALLVGLSLAVACAETSRNRCQSDSDVTTCGSVASCVWTRAGNETGYFCAIICNGGGACPSGQSCVPEVARSCQTCQDLVDVCE
jgi:hypothetical protein